MQESKQQNYMSGLVRNTTKHGLVRRVILSQSNSAYGYLDTMPYPMSVIDLDARFVYANRFMATLWGAPFDDLVGRLVFEGGPYDVRLKVRTWINQVVGSGLSVSATERCEGRWYHFNVAPVVDLFGSVVQVTFLVSEVTEDIETRLVLCKLNQALEQSVGMVFITDTNGNIEYINRGFTEMTGYSHDDVVGRNARILGSKTTPKETYQDLWQTILCGKTWDADVQTRRKDGSFFWASAKIAPIQDGEGHVVNFIASYLDVSAVKDVQKNLQESEARHALVLDGLQDGVWEWDVHSGAFEVSPRFLQNLGYGEGEIDLSGGKWKNFVHPDDRTERRHLLIEYMKGNLNSYACEFRVRNKSGTYIWLLEKGAALRDDAGRVQRMAGSISNITARKLAEDGLRRSEKLAAVGTLAAGIAHEFRNALVGVSGFAEIAMADTSDVEMVQLCLSEMAKASERAAQLTNDLLAFSRNQEVKPTNVKFDIREILRDTATLLKPILGQKHQLRMELLDRSVVVDSDPCLLSQVIINFCINGCDAMIDEGELTIGSRVLDLHQDEVAEHAKAAAGRYVQIFVRDTGTGIDKDTLKHIFDPFFTTKDPGKGTGLGLSVAYGIVERAGGFIGVESTLGKGSTFTINLPIVNES